MLKAQGKSGGRTGTRILLEAMSKDQVHLARFVLDALDGEIVDSRTEGAQTPLISSVLLPDAQARCKFVELLLQRGASVDCGDDAGRTALSYACERGHLDAVKILIRSGADPEVVDAWGNTALMYAAAAGHSHVVEFLVRAFKRLGLQIDRQNKVGNSAARVARFLGHARCVAALTSGSKKSREVEGNAQPRLGSGGGDAKERFERKVGHVGSKLEVPQTCGQADCQVIQSGGPQQRARVKQSLLPSMGSIEEFDREDGGSTPPPQELLFSGVLTPSPPARITDHPPNSKHPKPGERPPACDDHLPPLTQNYDIQKSLFFSPRPNRNPNVTSALGILLTPILANRCDSERGAEQTKLSDSGARRFHDSYYEKRCSLPCSVLVPAPPERNLVPTRKSRTVRRREASPCKAEPAAVTSTKTLSALSSKLLRRFTSPEFRKDVKESEEDPVLTSGRMPRSETFPQCLKHPQVGSKPSVDSISSVKCEFDFHFRAANS